MSQRLKPVLYSPLFWTHLVENSLSLASQIYLLSIQILTLIYPSSSHLPQASPLSISHAPSLPLLCLISPHLSTLSFGILAAHFALDNLLEMIKPLVESNSATKGLSCN
ncbi:hypothetical protein E2542_SST11124 [Spatholobus suberectus]|nr:hypothetical protein E2542_SST11124 [Spatholobus suberectus]